MSSAPTYLFKFLFFLTSVTVKFRFIDTGVMWGLSHAGVRSPASTEWRRFGIVGGRRRERQPEQNRPQPLHQGQRLSGPGRQLRGAEPTATGVHQTGQFVRPSTLSRVPTNDYSVKVILNYKNFN